MIISKSYSWLLNLTLDIMMISNHFSVVYSDSRKNNICSQRVGSTISSNWCWSTYVYPAAEDWKLHAMAIPNASILDVYVCNAFAFALTVA